MSIYALIGILRCPYRNECGPGKCSLDECEQADDKESMCFTRRHRECAEYLMRHAEDMKAAAMVIKD